MSLSITVCGVGEAAQVLMGVLGSRTDIDLRVLTNSGDETRRLESGLSRGGGITVLANKSSLTGRPGLVTHDAALTLENSQLILLAVPPSVQINLLRTMEPFLPPDVVIGAFPAHGGFNWAVQELLGDRFILFGLQTLPWTCQVRSFGERVAIRDMKSRVGLAVRPFEHMDLITRMLQHILRLPVQPLPHFLALTLANPEQLLHPGVMYALFHEWDGSPLETLPTFDEGLQNEIASILLQGLSNEIQGIKASIQKAFPELDMTHVRTLRQWLHRFYPEGIQGTTTLKEFLQIHPLFQGVPAPMLSRDGGYVPDYQAGVMTEDIPYGLLASRGLAALLELYTPTMDILIEWAQERMGKFYVHDHAFLDTDLQDSRAPQRFGIQRLEDLLEFS